MDSTKATGKTIGAVEKLTGIPKRELKYYIEQKIMCPAQRTESGYWEYGDEDIQKVQLTALCRNLGIPVGAIRRILTDPDSHWQEELERQITQLKNKRNLTEAQLHLAKRLQNNSVWEALQIYRDSLSEKDTALAVK